MIFDELLKLLPFYFSQILYWFIWYIPSEQPGAITLVIKCLPVLFLVNYLKNTTSYNDGNYLVQWLTKGMVFSMLGDALLVFENTFLIGILAFAFAQICFIKGFTFQPLKLRIGIILYLIMGLILCLILPGINDPVMKIGIPIYTTLLMTMAWRAIARMSLGVAESLTAFGAVIFVISDGLIGINLFYSKVPNAQIWIMSTYYIAQFLITLSGLKQESDVLEFDVRKKP